MTSRRRGPRFRLHVEVTTQGTESVLLEKRNIFKFNDAETHIISDRWVSFHFSIYSSLLEISKPLGREESQQNGRRLFLFFLQDLIY